MQVKDLDVAYTELAQAIGRVGEGQAQLFLATLSLSLIAKLENVDEALALIAQAEKVNNESKLKEKQ